MRLVNVVVFRAGGGVRVRIFFGVGCLRFHRHPPLAAVDDVSPAEQAPLHQGHGDAHLAVGEAVHPVLGEGRPGVHDVVWHLNDGGEGEGVEVPG